MQKNRRFLFIAMLLLSCFAYPENPMQKEHDKQLFEFESNFWGAFINEWVLQNLKIKNCDFPYQFYGGKFYFSENSTRFKDCKDWSVVLDFSLLGNEDFDSLGNETKLNISFFKFFGIKIENLMFPGCECDYYGNFKLGGYIQLLKYNPFSCDFFTAWSMRYDEKNLNGLVFGGTVKSYPLKPVKLEFSAAGHIFTNDEYSMEFTGHIGCLIKSVEIFAQYKYFQKHIFGVGLSRYF